MRWLKFHWLTDWLDNWLTDLFDAHYWTCGHRWCYREAVYQYRCYKHQDDP
ncbi:MAG TPA: hypothetical protein VIY48_15210 [Candidatus Paceibacterota bacterium]